MSGFPEKVYLASPIWLQQWMSAIWGWWWYRSRYGNEFLKLIEEYSEHDHWTAEQFISYQEQQLHKLLLIAQQSAYYRQIFTELGINPKMHPFDALRQLPFLSKESLRSNPADLLTQEPPRGTKIFHSAGTTGKPAQIYYPSRFHKLEIAISAVRSLGWAGVSYTERRVHVWLPSSVSSGPINPSFLAFQSCRRHGLCFCLSPIF